MKVQVTALALAAGILWGAAIFMVAIANLVWPNYGNEFLGVVASVYPGYMPGNGVASVLVGACYGLVDGAIAGAILGWLYTRFAAA